MDSGGMIKVSGETFFDYSLLVPPADSFDLSDVFKLIRDAPERIPGMETKVLKKLMDAMGYQDETVVFLELVKGYPEYDGRILSGLEEEIDNLERRRDEVLDIYGKIKKGVEARKEIVGSGHERTQTYGEAREKISDGFKSLITQLKRDLEHEMEVGGKFDENEQKWYISILSKYSLATNEIHSLNRSLERLTGVVKVMINFYLRNEAQNPYDRTRVENPLEYINSELAQFKDDMRIFKENQSKTRAAYGAKAEGPAEASPETPQE